MGWLWRILCLVCIYLLFLNLCCNHSLFFSLPLLPLGSYNNLLCLFGYDFADREEMVIDHALSMEFSFGSLLHLRILPLLYKGHTTLLLFIRNQHRLRAGSTLPIFEQSLGFYHCFGILVVSHEEGVVLLLLRAFVELVVGLAYI